MSHFHVLKLASSDTVAVVIFGILWFQALGTTNLSLLFGNILGEFVVVAAMYYSVFVTTFEANQSFCLTGSKISQTEP